ncbi:src substrate cortactin-like isoform X2 [Cervus canadensis]|uniref:src substrate cortactin-like isoform X2 n=1 Tax=Cervus canadensis TaxID=1574408 RepID=UPI001CA369DA|nr:src substrate cortactin-like isoform X2 [Cervus canadensis]
MCLVNREELSSTEWNAVHVVAPESTDACLGCLCDRFVRLPSLPSQVSTSFSLREKELEMGPKASPGYRGKFGVEQDRMDKSAVGHEYQSKLSKCCLQVDSIWGFRGECGVQLDRVDQKHLLGN